MKFALIALFALLSLGRLMVFAEELNISGNGARTETTVKNTIEKKETVIQQNSSVITNTINGKASTGNNSISGNTDGSASIVTGDSSVSVRIQNQANVNNAKIECCITPTITPANPSQKPSNSDSQTPTSNTSTATNTTNPSSLSNSGGIGGGEILGLAVTSSIDWINLASNIGGILCLGIGSTLITRKQKSKK